MKIGLDTRLCKKTVLWVRGEVGLDQLYSALCGARPSALVDAQANYVNSASSMCCSMLDQLLYQIIVSGNPSPQVTQIVADSVINAVRAIEEMSAPDYRLKGTFAPDERRIVARADFRGEPRIASCFITILSATQSTAEVIRRSLDEAMPTALLDADPQGATLADFEDPIRSTLVVEIVPADVHAVLTPEVLHATQRDFDLRMSDMSMFANRSARNFSFDAELSGHVGGQNPSSPAQVLPRSYPLKAFESPRDFVIDHLRRPSISVDGDAIYAELIRRNQLGATLPTLAARRP